MSELVQIRHRIKAIKTIQKITRAMCLVSMATHTRLRSKKQFIDHYDQTTQDLFSLIHTFAPEWQQKAFLPTKDGKRLIIIIGSQKGLCGVFNSNLFSFFTKKIIQYPAATTDVIKIGQRIGEYAHLSAGTTVKEFNDVSMTTMNNIALQCAQFIIQSPEPYSSVIVFSNQPKSFFIQKPHTEQLIPFPLLSNAQAAQNKDLIWEHNPHMLLDILSVRLLEIRILRLIFESLLAEQAARFIAMDGATRNANNLLSTMQLAYNKIRQSKITRELTDLIGSFF